MKLENLNYEQPGPISGSDALIVVDMQNDFMPGGALPVDKGDTIIHGINSVMKGFFENGPTVVLTQDWHPPGHRSFASVHKGMKPFDPYTEDGIGPVLWPDHCVQGSTGADFHKEMETRYFHAVIRKGFNKAIDSYSGFLENDRITKTGLGSFLYERGIRRIFLCGLALDYCVYYTAVDGAGSGFRVCCIPELTMPVGSPENSVSDALEGMSRQGVVFVKAGDISFR